MATAAFSEAAPCDTARGEGGREINGMRLYRATIKDDALKPKSRHAYYSRQKALFIMVVTLVSVIPLIGIGFFSFRYYKNSWIEETSRELANLADSRRETIDLFLNNQDNLINSLMNLYTPEYLSRQDNLETVFNATNSSGVITDLGAIDAAGSHLAYVGPYSTQLAERNYSQADWFAEVMSQGSYISDIFSGFRGEPHFIVAVADPSRSFILRATVNSDSFNALLATAEVGPGGDAFILNRGGELQTPSRLEFAGLPFPLNGIPAGGDPTVRHDGDFIYATTSLKSGDWVLVLKEDINSSLAEFNSARNRAVILIGLAFIAIVTVAALITSSMVNRLREADIERLALDNRVLEAEKMALIGRLASSVSHEINNPLQIIENQAGWIGELLQDENPQNVENLEEYRKALKKISAHVNRAKTITHRLLGFSRAAEAPLARTSLNDLIEETITFLENEANRNQIVVEREFQHDLPAITTDPTQLQQVLLNILNNAIDAIGRDGTITIRTHTANSMVAAEFSDSGPGLSDEILERIYEPFFTTKAGKRTGLGLSISYHIIHKLGGEIEARNRKEGGSIFTVRLPAGGQDTEQKRGEEK